MAGIDRTTILTGPALVTFGGQSFWSKGDVMLKPVTKKFDIMTSHFGKVDTRRADQRIEVSFEPAGTFSSGLAAVVWPYAATSIGASIYGSTDRALVVWSRDGVKVTVPNASVTKMPDIRLGVDKTVMGQIVFTGLLAKSTDPSSAGAYYTMASASYPGDTGFAVANIPTQSYSSVWGAVSPWSSFLTEAGWDISFGLTLKEHAVDGMGTVDMVLQGLTVEAKAIPVGPTVTDVLAKTTPASALGSSLANGSANLVLSNAGGTALYVLVYNAAISDAEIGYGPDRKRLGMTTWMATRTVTAGAADPLFYIGTSAPS